MKGPLTILPATARDIDAVMAVMVDAFDPAFGEAWNANQCLGILGLPGVWMTLARRGDVASGFALSRVVVDEAELLLIGVSRAFRRDGVGSALLDQVTVDARQRGAQRLHLEVRDGNPAMHLYRKREFHQIGSRRAYYRGVDGRSYDALSLARAIDNHTELNS